MRAFVVVLLLIGAPIVSAEESEKPAPAKRVLELEIRLPDTLQGGQPLALASVFTNRGEVPVSFFVPRHVERTVFPTFVFTDAEGQDWTPHVEPVQSRWIIGLHGEVVTLVPGQSRTFAFQVDRFVRVQDPNSQRWNLPTTLRAGAYRVSARYAQETNELVHGVQRGAAAPFASEKRAHAGLWTGTLTARSHALRVTPPATTTLTIDGPDALVPGRPFEVAFELRNGSDEPFVFDGTTRVTGASKACGSGSILVRVPGAVRGKPRTLAPGQVVRWSVDLGDRDFQPGHQAKRRNPDAAPLASILRGRGTFVLVAKVGDPERSAEVASNELWRLRTER